MLVYIVYELNLNAIANEIAETSVEEVSAIALEVRSRYIRSSQHCGRKLNAIAETIVDEVSAITLEVRSRSKRRRRVVDGEIDRDRRDVR